MNEVLERECNACRGSMAGAHHNALYCDTCRGLTGEPAVKRPRKCVERTEEERQAIAAYNRAYHQERKGDPAYRAKRNGQAKRYHRNNRSVHYIQNARARAKALGLPCTITKADIVIPQFCPILGIPLIHGDGQHSDNSPSLDRIRPHLGYVPGNVQIISNRANRIKNDATPEELRMIANYLEQLS